MKLIDVLLAVAVMVIWGFNFVAAKWGLAQSPPILLMALRFGVVAALLLPFVRAPRGRLLAIAALSVTLGAVHFSLMFTGLSRLGAGLAAVVTQVQVPFAAILAAFVFGDYLGWRRALGMAIAFAGVFVLTGEPEVAADPGPLLLVVAAAFMWAVSNIQIKRLGAINGYALNAYLGLCAAPQLLASSLVFEQGQRAALAAADLWLVGSVLYMAVMVQIVSYLLWFRLVRAHPVNQVMPFTLLVPVFGVAAGAIFLGETLSWRMIVGGLMTVAGVAVIVLRRPRLAAPAAAAKTT